MPMRRKPNRALFYWVLLADLAAIAVAANCAMDDDDDLAPPTGTAQIALATVPADVGCLRVQATGTRTVERGFDVTAGQEMRLQFDHLPTGNVAFSAAAFAGRCAIVPAGADAAWISDPVWMLVMPNTATNIALTMRRSGHAGVDIRFASDAPAARPPL
jgi:hypothetical protein